MKTLLIMRHANSSWSYPDLSDFDRPLSKQGLQTAPFMGNIIYDDSLKPDLIISSSAKRAKQTAVLIKSVAEVKAEIEFSDKIYEASPTTLLLVISKVKDKNTKILLIGHNPGIEDFIRILTGKHQHMSSASIVKISLDIESWVDITNGCGCLEMIMCPEDLMEKTKNVEEKPIADEEIIRAEYSQSLW